MRKIIVWLCLSLLPIISLAEAPKVPRTIYFAGVTLKLNEKARGKIQAEVNALTKHPKYFQVKVDRLQMYFPIIERIFKEEGLPEDFKYLSLQESALISDAVSSSKAVGYWQFKKAAALEVGLRIDRNIDERKNIVSATRGAARYLKKNNNLYFDNWVHALLAYHQGPGGAMKLVGKKYRGARSMPINGQTHWYVIKFLAHKIAFEPIKSAPPKLFLAEYYDGKSKTIKQIAQNNRLSYELVLEYNKWLSRGRVPADKPYAVILPMSAPTSDYVAQSVPPRSNSRQQTGTNRRIVSNSPETSTIKKYITQPEKFPQIYGAKKGTKSSLAKINGIAGIVVGTDDDLDDLVRISGVDKKRLLFYNDVPRARKLREGEIWYLKPKKSKAKAEYHIVEAGETLRDISQKYGLKLSKLRTKNRIDKRQEVKTGRVLWLRFIRSADEPIAYQAVESPIKERKLTAPTKATKAAVVQTRKTTESTVAQDTVQRPNPSSPTTKIADAAPVKTEPEQVEYQEEEEFALEEPVNFVGVDKSENVTNVSQMVHLVNAGETLYAISRKYGVSIDQLRELNNLTESSDLAIGQELVIKRAVLAESAPQKKSQVTDYEFFYYQVKPGETLYQIARDHQATIKELMEWNEKSDFSIAEGEQLKIRKQP